MQSPRLLLAAVLAAGTTLAAGAALQAQPPAPWATLADQPATHTSFSFDRSEIQAAEGMLQQNGLDASRAAAAITSVTVDSYHYAQPAFYTPEAMTAMLATYHQAGWKHLVNANQASGNPARPTAMFTDLWLHFTGADIDGVNVLLRGPRDMNVIQLACDLRPLDLVHLSGHFGIPKVDPNAVMVPAAPGK